MPHSDLKISVCIPVYNCAEFVGQALDSILPQTDERIEVIVYDGGSTDRTTALMDSYVKVWPNLQYHRGHQRGGIDADMATCVGFAQAQYCWLFSGDDVMRAGAIKRALEWIERGSDIYICKHTICSKEMVVSHEHPVMLPDQAFTANLANTDERMEWFRRAFTTEAFFSFISALIIRREKWQSGELPEAFSKSCWGHVARFLKLIDSGLNVCYVGEVWLDQRGENDSFADKGVVNRFRIGIEGYHRLADSFFGHESMEAFHIRRVIRNEFTLASFIFAKVQCKRKPEIEDRLLLDKLVRMTYCDNSLPAFRARFSYWFFPYWLFVVIRPAYIAIKPLLRRIKLA
jgi:abequosyltransferase